MKIFFNRKTNKKIAIISVFILELIILLILSSNNSSILNHTNKSNNGFSNSFNDSKLKLSNDDSILFQGIENPLNVTDYGNLYNNSQEITLTNKEELNLTYLLDDIYGWKVSNIKNSIKNLQDTKNWINNNDFQSISVFNKTIGYTGSYNSLPPSGWKDSTVISHSGAYAMRVHFDYLNIIDAFDYIRIQNNMSITRFVDNGYKNNFFSPWIKSDELDIDFYSNADSPSGSYRIDYYEFINSSSNYFVNDEYWDLNEDTLIGSEYGSGDAGNISALYLALFSDAIDDYLPNMYSNYGKYNFTEIYQNLNIPRGKIVNAYISFDYYPEFCMETNNIFIYVSVNNKKIYSIYFGDIFNAGKYKWYSSGKIYMPLWSNTSNIFEGNLHNQDLNISIGLKSVSDGYYSGFDDAYQQMIWFDNLTLEITAIANSTQDDIELKIEKTRLNEENEWGSAFQILNNTWEKNPIILTINTTSPSIYFELDTILYGFCNLTTDYDRDYHDGVSYKILNNGTILWEFLHDFFKPSEYTDFEFTINKPINWKIISAKNQAGYFKSFEGGRDGDSFLKINKTNIYEGWWTFTATSPNYLNLTNTKMLKNGDWGYYSFKSGEITKIKTQVNYSNEKPSDVSLTSVNLTIYHPNGTVWYKESKHPEEDGYISFSDITFGSFNTSGGYYIYTLFWSNKTALGGIKSSFLVIHNSSLILLKPSDAKQYFQTHGIYKTNGLVGDLFPLEIFLKDSENNKSISDSIISYNWTGGLIKHFGNDTAGIYDTYFDTSGLSIGNYSIIIYSSKIGFFSYNITLMINLGESTNLYILKSQYFVELHANSSIELRFTGFSGTPIDGANVEVNISNHKLYSINNTGDGVYIVEFNTSYINNTGIYKLQIKFEAGFYIPQEYTHQFQIVAQSVNLTIYINNDKINQNSIIETSFNEELTVSARALAKNDKIYLGGGNFTWISASFTQNITEKSNTLYNTSFICFTSSFSLGYNYVYIEFQKSGYATSIFPFQLIVNQIPIQVIPIDFEDSVDTFIGKDATIEIQLKEPVTNYPIEGAIVSYSWEYGIGSLDPKGNGIYELELELPDDIEEGDYKIKIIISAGSAYKPTEYSFVLDVTEEEKEEINWLFWIILVVLLAIIGVLSSLSYRSYIYLPRKRKKEAELLAKTQRFKDLMNIQAIVVTHKQSGIPVFLKSYSILETQKKELFSGFIQAITSIGEEFSGKKAIILEDTIAKEEEKVIELDFKHFYCLICDKISVRVILVLKEKSSDRLKTILRSLSRDIYTNLNQKLEKWDGELIAFEKSIPEHLEKYLELYYKEQFKLAKPQIFAEIRKDMELNSMETRVVNVIRSFAKNKSEFYLTPILELVYEKNKDIVIEAIESLINKKLVIPYIPTTHGI